MTLSNRPMSDKHLQRVTVCVSDIGQSLAKRFNRFLNRPPVLDTRDRPGVHRSVNSFLLGKANSIPLLITAVPSVAFSCSAPGLWACCQRYFSPGALVRLDWTTDSA